MRAEAQTSTRRKTTAKRVRRLNPALVAISNQANQLGLRVFEQTERIYASDPSPGWLQPVIFLHNEVLSLHETIRDLEERGIPTGLSPQHVELSLELIKTAISQIHQATRLAPQSDIFTTPPSLRLHLYLWLVIEIRGNLSAAMYELYHLSDQSKIWAAWDGYYAPPGA